MLANDLHTCRQQQREQYMLLVIRDLGSTKKKGSLESVFLCFWQYFAPQSAARARTVADIV